MSQEKGQHPHQLIIHAEDMEVRNRMSYSKVLVRPSSRCKLDVLPPLISYLTEFSSSVYVLCFYDFGFGKDKIHNNPM